MKIFSCIKPVVDPSTRLLINESKTWIKTKDLTFIASEADNYALEEALRLREKHGGETVVISVGGEEAAKEKAVGRQPRHRQAGEHCGRARQRHHRVPRGDDGTHKLESGIGEERRTRVRDQRDCVPVVIRQSPEYGPETTQVDTAGLAGGVRK